MIRNGSPCLRVITVVLLQQPVQRCRSSLYLFSAVHQNKMIEKKAIALTFIMFLWSIYIWRYRRHIVVAEASTRPCHTPHTCALH